MRLSKKGTKRYQKILDRKCGGEWTHDANGSDFDCQHDYSWTCDVCPINTNAAGDFVNEIVEILI